MAKYVMKHPHIDIDGTDLHDHASSLEITTEYAEVEDTSFCSDLSTFQQGLGDATWTIDFFQDHTAGETDSVLWPLAQSGSAFLMKATPGIGTTEAQQGSASANNPMYSMTARLFSYSPIAGAIGEMSTTSVTFRNAGTLGVTRATAGTTV